MDQPKAVLCDDDRTLSLIIKKLLEKAGFCVFAGQNGQEGLTLVNTHHPSVLVTDLDMPVKDGIQLLQELKESKQIPPWIIVLTSHESAEDEARVKALGAREMIVKPFQPSELVRKLQDLIVSKKI
jgi:DNA-binding response OmpR family regulator